MLKSGPMKGVKDPKDLQFLAGFLTAMEDAVRSNPDLLDGEDTPRMVVCVQTLMDMSAVPSAVQEAHKILSGVDHRLANVWKLDKGKKLVQLALEHAEKRASQGTIMTSIADMVTIMEGKAYIDLESDNVSGFPKLFGGYGEMTLGLWLDS